MSGRFPRIASIQALVVVASALGAMGPAYGSVVRSVTGNSAKAPDFTPVSFDATFTVSGDILTLVLRNNGGAASVHPDDVLSSFYFDIFKVDNGTVTRPTLTLTGATGTVYLVNKDVADVSQGVKDVRVGGDISGDGWQFKQGFDVTNAPFLGFGVGTVGNAELAPNGFNGNRVDGVKLSIYAGDVITSNLDRQNQDDYFIKGSVTFTFSGMNGYTEGNYTEADIAENAVFGLGTAPDSYLQVVPEPSTLIMLSLGALGTVVVPLWRKRKR